MILSFRAIIRVHQVTPQARLIQSLGQFVGRFVCELVGQAYELVSQADSPVGCLLLRVDVSVCEFPFEPFISHEGLVFFSASALAMWNGFLAFSLLQPAWSCLGLFLEM